MNFFSIYISKIIDPIIILCCKPAHLPGGANPKGTVACEKRGVERTHPEVVPTMDRFTNPFNSAAGYHFPNMKSIEDYVVSSLPRYMNQPAASSRLTEGNPKVGFRLDLTEFGISRKVKAWGRRRTRSTTFICRKGSSLTNTPSNLKLSGYKGDDVIKTFKLNTNNKITNLSDTLSNPDFLVGCWVRIRSKGGSITPAFLDTLDGINEPWFIKTAGEIKNGLFKFSPARRMHIPKPNGKRRPLTIPSPRDKIVQEGIRTLLEQVFEPEFRNSSYGFRANRGCHDALKDIRKRCKAVTWYVEGDIDQQFPSINHGILLRIIQEKVEDQAFIDLIYKYLRTGYGETADDIRPMKIGVMQGGNLSPLLSNIYMHSFDVWMEDTVIPSIQEGIKRKRNPEYFAQYYANNRQSKDKTIRSVLSMDPSWKRAYYFRYADDFIVGVDGSKEDCVRLRNEIRCYLRNTLELTLNVEKTRISHAETRAARFLGYKIHKTPLKKMPIRVDSKGRKCRIVPRPLLTAPIDEIKRSLIDKGYAKGNVRPRRNARLINHTLDMIVNHHKSVERGVLNYYALANNYGKLAGLVHYILKYSCVLTIASKMKLGTMRKVFKKYGKDLRVKGLNGKYVSYPTPSYKRPRYSNLKTYDENFIVKLHNRIHRGRQDLEGTCVVCGTSESIEIHHVRALRKSGRMIRKDFLSRMMSAYNRKQIPLCSKCHRKVHKGEHDGKKL